MSKMDDLRAMREARYDKRLARAAKPTARPTGAEQPGPKPGGAQPPAANPEVQPCGHRAISGRTCTREQGHAAKSHRYA
jgi:hypothetical protein